MLKIKRTKINLGLLKPFSVLHISDTHFTLADSRDNERKISLSEVRKKEFTVPPEEKIRYAEDFADGNGLKIIHTGDLIDFVSEANLERAKRFIYRNDVLFVAGNHEFSLYVGEEFEDEAYRNRSLEHVQRAFKDNIRFNARQLGGVNFVGIDNGYYRFEQWQLAALKRQVGIGLPIVLFVHNPLFEPKLFEEDLAKTKGFCANVVGTPEEYLKLNNEARQIVLRPDEATLETYGYIKSQPLIKAVLAGHLHYDFESMLTDKLPQYVTGITTMRCIDFS